MQNFSTLINSLNIDEASKLIMHKIVGELLHIITEKDKIIKAQSGEILELQRQLNMDSSNSSESPSTDMNKKNKKPKGNDNNDATGTKSSRGGKLGHKGVTLNQMKKPDIIKKVMLDSCNCGSTDLRITGRYESR